MNDFLFVNIFKTEHQRESSAKKSKVGSWATNIKSPNSHNHFGRNLCFKNA